MDDVTPEDIAPHLDPIDPDNPHIPKATAEHRKRKRATENAHRGVQSRMVVGLLVVVVLLILGWGGTVAAFSISLGNQNQTLKSNNTTLDNQAVLLKNQAALLRRRNVATDAISCFSGANATFSKAIRDVIQGAVADDKAREIKGSAALDTANFDVCVSTPTTTTTTTPGAP